MKYSQIQPPAQQINGSHLELVMIFYVDGAVTRWAILHTCSTGFTGKHMILQQPEEKNMGL